MNGIELNILLADDDIDDCFFFKGALEEFSLLTHLTSVHDGEQLMQLLTSEIEEQNPASLPHVLFLDLNMPRKNGFECLSEIKLNKKLKQLPVIMYSTSFEQEVVNLLYKNGAQHFIRKPSEYSQFKKIIQQTLSYIAQGLSANEQENISPIAWEDFVLTVQDSSSLN